MTPLVALFDRVRAGDHDAFTAWLSRVEPALRAGLRGFARGVDVEAVLQEGLMRMWVLAPGLELDGENASLRYALVLDRNLARHESRRHGTLVSLEPDPDGHAPPEPSVPPLLVDVLARPSQSRELTHLDERSIELTAHNIVVLGHMWTFRRWFLGKHYSIEDYIMLQTAAILRMCTGGKPSSE